MPDHGRRSVPVSDIHLPTIAGTSALIVLLAAVIFAAPAARAQGFSVLTSFSGPNGDAPNADLAMDAAGNVYGTTFYGGNSRGLGGGTVFKLSRHGSSWILSTLYSFTGYADGGNPWGGVIFGPDGSLYGTTAYGGSNSAGTVFKLQPPLTSCKSAMCPWRETVLYNFTGQNDGCAPIGKLAFDRGGNLYGVAGLCGQGGYGALFELSPSGGSWNITVVHTFTGASDGGSPDAGVVLDQDGNLYGTTYRGGTYSAGVVYEFSYGSLGLGWTETILHNFGGSGDGKGSSGLVFDTQGNLFGATEVGGTMDDGTVYELQPSGGGGFSYAILYNFDPQLTGSPAIVASLSVDSAGNLYGTGEGGGTYGDGTVFELSPDGGSWNFTVLNNFTYYDGYEPGSTPLLDGQGNLYGTTESGGAYAYGVVWEWMP